MNPLDTMQLAGRLGIFKNQHPKFGKFLKSVAGKGLEEGSVMEVRFRAVDGEEYLANIKLTKEDVETLDIIKNMGQAYKQ